MLSNTEKQQYNRHIILDEIGVSGQEKLKAAKVLVIGAGGLGCPILQYLTAAGVGTIGIVDDDVVDMSNLQRQVLYTVADVGASKAQTAATKLSQLNPFVFFKVYTERLNTENAIELFEAYDIVVDGSDNFPTRYLVNDACVLTDTPLVFGSIFKFQGQVSVLNYQGGPTYRCLFPDPPAPDAVPNCSDIGVLGVLPGIIGSLQANEVLKMITGIGTVLKGKLLYLDALTLEQQVLRFTKNEAIEVTALEDDYAFFCGIHPESYAEITMADVKENMEAYQLLDVRTAAEFEKFNIGGMHIPLEALSAHIATLPSSRPIVVCCQSGVRSKVAAQLIAEHRKDLTVFNLQGGIFTM